MLSVGSALAIRMEGRVGLARRSELTMGRVLLYWVVIWSISVKTGLFLALWTAGVQREGASVFISALGGVGGSPFPPSEVLAMVDLEITDSTGEIV